jgi:amino acid transporter
MANGFDRRGPMALTLLAAALIAAVVVIFATLPRISEFSIALIVSKWIILGLIPLSIFGVGYLFKRRKQRSARS